ncbi:MAG: hypothetical protein HXS44_09410 [Theionarchaea archaeon]|nr:hypothetical protein [Theionarchaea archaeon]
MDTKNRMKWKTWIIGISVVLLLIVVSMRGFGMFGSDKNLSSADLTPSSVYREPPPSLRPGSPSPSWISLTPSVMSPPDSRW